MPRLAIIFGLLLSALAAVGYLNTELLGSGSSHEFTALIPGFFGVALILCGVISMFAPDLRKHAMHVAAMVALFGVLGGAGRLIPVAIKSGFDFEKASTKALVLMIVLSAVFLFLCIRSFIQARKARQAGLTSPTP